MKKSWDLNSEKVVDTLKIDGEKGIPIERGAGYGFWLSAFFMVAQMSGAGFLSLPKALAGTGWTGVAMITIFCFIGCYAAIRLGRCWVILEERWPEEYLKPSRQPYMDISYRSYGTWGRNIARWALMGNLIGATIVYIIIIAGMFSGMVPSLSQCQWVLIVGACLLPFTFLGTPKDFWQASVIAVSATVVAVIVVVYKLIDDNMEARAEIAPVYAPPTFSSFSVAYGAILFAFGGAAVFPNVQNDMKDRTKFGLGAGIAFLGILAMYLPVAATGYYFLGSDVQSNILLAIGSSPVVIVAIALQLVNLLATYLIVFNPMALTVEDMLQLPSTFGWQRVVTRTTLLAGEILIALAVPDFGMILNLLGGSAVAILSFIFPAICYMKLVNDKSNKNWPERTISTFEKIFLWFIIIIGVIGAISSTIFALIDILNPKSFGQSCFVHFGRRDNSLLKFSGVNITSLE